MEEHRSRGDREMVEPVSAATVVLLRERSSGFEVLLARRSSKLAFHGGAWVFPGGRIDPEDYASDDSHDLSGAARRAAVREAYEEANVIVDPESLVHFAQWTTPDNAPKRFATWFFVTSVAGGNERADGSETEALHWFRPVEALEARRVGEIELAPPQFVTLLALADHRDIAGALDGFATNSISDYSPRFHFLPGGGAICVYAEDVGYADLDLLDTPGRRHRLVMTETSWEYVQDP